MDYLCVQAIILNSPPRDENLYQEGSREKHITVMDFSNLVQKGAFWWFCGPSQCYSESTVMEIHEAKGLWLDTLGSMKRAASQYKKCLNQSVLPSVLCPTN